MHVRSLPISTTPEVFWLHNNASLTAVPASGEIRLGVCTSCESAVCKLCRVAEAIDEGSYISRIRRVGFGKAHDLHACDSSF